MTTSMTNGDNPEELEIARNLIDQANIFPRTDGDPTGIAFIGNLIDLLKTAGLGEPAGQGESGVT